MVNNFTIEEVRRFWDSVAQEYEHHHQKEDLSSTHFQRFEIGIPYLDLKPGSKLLNIWSRTGEAIPYIRKKQLAVELHNLEASVNFLNIAKKNFPKEHFKLSNLQNLSYPDKYFDAILSLETLEHVPKPLFFLKELNRVLKPNGQLVMSLPPSAAEIPLKIYETLFSNHGEGPHKFLFPSLVKELLEEANFELRLHRGTLLIPVGPKFLRDFGERIIEAFQRTPIRNLGIRQFYICRKK